MYIHPVALARAGRAVSRIVKVRRWSRKAAAFSLGFTTIAVVAAAGAMTYLNRSVVAITPPLVLGELPFQKLTSQAITDRAAVEVNVANGNMIMKTQDLAVRSAGPGLNVTRYFNDLASGSGQVGSKTTLGVGADVSITPNGSSAIYQGPSGYKVTFTANGSGGYASPAEFTGGTLAAVSGGGWTLTYNQSGEVYTFNASGKLTKDATRSGLATTYGYNANGTLATATDDQGKVTTFTNYSGTNVGKITDPTGRYVQYTYTSGQLTGVRDAMGNTWAFQYYDTRGNLNQIVDPRGYTTTLTYDSSNRVTSIKYNDYTSAVATWTYAYNNGNTVVTDPLNHTTTYTYDTSGRVTDVLDAVGAHRGSGWDAKNNQVSSTDPSNKATTYTYDTLNNLTQKQLPNTAGGQPGAKDMYAYANAAQPYRPSQSTDGQGNTVAYSYNTAGNNTQSASSSQGGTGMGNTKSAYQGDPSGSTTINCGAKPGQLCTTTDANNNVTTYAYNTNGDVTSITPPGPVGAKTYTYDALDRVKTITDGNGSKVTLTYDNMDRPTNLAYAADGSAISYAYDQNGNMYQRNDGAGQTNYQFDGMNRTTQIAQSGQTALNYTYDLAGNLKTEQGPAGTVTYGYDNANQIASVNQSVNGANQTFIFTDGRPTTIYIPGNIVETIGYDTAGRQTSIKATRNGVTLTDYSATYAKSNGSDTELMQTETNNLTGVTSTYAYDGVNRLTSATGSGTGSNTFTYSYDNNGNRTQTSKNGVYSAIYGYNAANELVTAGGAQNGTYDQAGNQKSTGSGLSFNYNAKNQTSSMTPAGGSTISMNYLDVGQTGRVQFGATSQQNGLLGLYSDTTAGAATYYHHLPGGSNQIIGQTKGSNTYYYLTDLRGSVVKMTDGQGTIQNTYSYDPYGVKLASTGSIANPIQYAGGYYDASTGLYKFGARYYNAADARWTQLDPSGQSFGYLYADANPVNFVDPSGYISGRSLLVTAGGAIGTAVAVAACPATAGVGCAVALGTYGGFVGAGLTSKATGASQSQIEEDAINGGLGGALGGAPIGRAVKALF